MRHYIRTVAWKFMDPATTYPGLSNEKKIYIYSPREVFESFQCIFKDQVRERFLVIWLNTANRVCGFEIVTEGILNSSLVHPREVFRGAIVATCASIILAHNHPSGNPEPSAEDVQITRQMVETGKIIGIPVRDHVIFAEGQYTSLSERGLV